MRSSSAGYNRGRALHIAAFLCFSVSCSKGSLTSSSAVKALPPVVYSEWAIAQRNLAPYVGDRALAITPDAFRWIEHGGKFHCPPDPEPRYDGCFGPDNPLGPTIEWGHSGVLAHEIGHGVLWILNDPRWSCYQHDDPNEPANFEEACATGIRR